MQAINSDYINENKDKFINELIDLLKIPSVSADPKFKADVLKTADFIKDKLIAIGADNVEICPTAGYPIRFMRVALVMIKGRCTCISWPSK